MLGPTGRSAPQNGLTRVGRHPRMVVPGRSGTPKLPDSMYIMCYVVCGMMGELTKLHAYGLQFWFQVLCLNGKESAWSQRITLCFPHTRSLGLYSDMVS